MLLAVSRVNESVPLFVVEGLKRRLGDSLAERKVAVLGLAFKGDSDDERDSLAHKLIRLLERELADVAVHDARVQTPTSSLQDAVRDADVIVIAANHAEYTGPEMLDGSARGARLADRRPLGCTRARCRLLAWGAGGGDGLMPRVLVTGAAHIGSAVVRRLLAEPT